RAVREGSVRYSFLFMHTEEPRMIAEMAGHGFAARWIRYDEKKRKRGLLKALPWLWCHMLRARPDVVHCNMFDEAVAGLLDVWLCGVTVRGATKPTPGYHWYYARKWWWVVRLASRLSSEMIASDTESKQYLLEKEHEPARKIRLVHNGIPPERFTD